ncbi:hypothetical protein [Hydrococcus rivularis]|uniref:hypothetical protein n=1 Tax=Hydrococcus rivularis TaxID=1616834 RepID=UPI003184235A
MRSERDSFFKIGLLTNPMMLWAVIITFLLQTQFRRSLYQFQVFAIDILLPSPK